MTTIKPTSKKVSLIIVSYNTCAYLLACLASLKKAQGEKEIFVVDNNSSDNTVEQVKRAFPEVYLIKNHTNLGFGAANNRALPLCQGEYVIFLNPDTLLKNDTIEKAVNYMENHPEVGLGGARILNPDGSLQESVSYRYPGGRYAKAETSNLAGEIACVLGAFMIARRKLIEDLGGFDEDFFLYGEDEDLCWRIRERGFKIGYIPEAEVIHWGGASERATLPLEVTRKKILAAYTFYRKHYRPETIARIRHRERLQAYWRLFSLSLTKFFTRNPARHMEKKLRYRLILEMTERTIP